MGLKVKLIYLMLKKEDCLEQKIFFNKDQGKMLQKQHSFHKLFKSQEVNLNILSKQMKMIT